MSVNLDPRFQPPADLMIRAAACPHRPRFHFTAPAGWLNDPNGLTHRDGVYHLFYQYNPEAPVHHRIHWGHAVSTDLITWRDLPIALSPEPGPDEEGCWSGVLVDDDGVPTLVYSGRRDGRELPCLATGSADLTTWRKDPANPVIPGPPTGLDVTAFRDHCVWREQDTWRQIIGSGIRGVGGTALLYESPDLRSWTYLGPLLTGDGAGTADRGPLWTGTMWECVDLFRLPGSAPSHDILVFSAWDEGVTHHPLYWSGHYTADGFTPEQLHRLDFGGRYFYAPQTMLDGSGRRLMFGWMQEGRSDSAAVAAGWSGVMSLPRVLSLRTDGSLYQEPVPEVALLRGPALYDGDVAELSPGVITGDQLDLELDLFLPEESAATLTLRSTPDGQERTTYTLTRRGAVVEIALDRQSSSLDSDVDTLPLDGTLPAPADGRVTMRVLVDHSALEAFVDGHPLSARVYPTRADALGVAVGLHGASVSLRAWPMAAAARPSAAPTEAARHAS